MTESETAKLTLWGFVDAFGEALVVELAKDTILAETWHILPCRGQEDHTFAQLEDFMAEYDVGDVPVPWLKIALLAMAAWVRENHPDLFPDTEPEYEIPF